MKDRSLKFQGNKLNSFGLFSLLASVLFVASSNFAFAQVSASLSGKIEDSSGAAITLVTVTITNLETGATRTVPTDETGNYQALSLPVGLYEVRAEKPGFSAAVRKGIDLVVGQAAVVNLRLEVGNVEQQVTVTAEAPLVNTTTAEVAGLVGERQVKELPLNGRSFDNLIALNAGAIRFTEKSRGAVASGLGNSFTVSGRRPSENLFSLNGVEYTGPNGAHALPGGVSGQLLGIDAVREFNVVSDTYSAEYGKRAGAQVSIVTQSGTNRLHGTLFEFLRNNTLDARNFFDRQKAPNPTPVPPFQRNQFGGAAGGPIQKDRTFIFGNYEGFRHRWVLTSVIFVPDENARRGLLPNAQGVPTPVAGLNPRMLPFMAFWPNQTGPSLAGGIAQANTNPKESIQEDFGTVRVDRTISGQDSLSGVYTVDEGNSTTPGPDPVFGIIVHLRNQVLSLQETHVFSPSVINTFTAGLSRAGFLFTTPPLIPLPSGVSFVQGEVPGTIAVGGIQGTGQGSTVFYSDYKSLFTYSDGLQVIRGKHLIALGAWFQWLRSNTFGAASTAGSATFLNLQTFLAGTARTFTVVPNASPHAWRQLEGAWYLQDTVQVRPNLSVRLGLRHEFTNGWNDANGKAANYLYDPNGVLLQDLLVGRSVLTENNAKWLFSPRVGLSWDPFGKAKTSIRAGFGTYYSLQDFLDYPLKDVAPPTGFNNSADFEEVSLFSLLPVIPTTRLPPACGPGVPSPCTTYAPKGINPRLHTQTVQEWSFSVEHQITLNTALRASYIGSHGYYEVIPVNPNTVRPAICSGPGGCRSGGIRTPTGVVPMGAEYIPVGTRPNPYLSSATIWASESSASYNALKLELTHRYASGLQFRGNYTWGKNLNIGTGVGPSDAGNEANQQMDPYDLRREWGPSANDYKHQFSLSGGYELPFGHGKPWLSGVSGAAGKLAGGWQLNAIVSLLSGAPFTPQTGSNQSGNGGGGDRPSVNPAFTGKAILGSPDLWFDPKAYILPMPGTFGNLGRGVLRGPGLSEVDLSLFKDISLTERVHLQFRAESFNLLNHANFSPPGGSVFGGSGTISPSAGVITTTGSKTSRQIQLGLKLNF